MSSEDGSLCRRALKGGYVTAYWGAKPQKAKLAGYSNHRSAVYSYNKEGSFSREARVEAKQEVD
jgi:hypothetical protein